MRHFTVITIVLAGNIALYGQSSKERSFVLTLKKVVAALSKRDSVTLTKYIDKKIGVYVLNRIGVVDTYDRFSTLGFSDTTYPNAPFYDNVKLTSLNYSTLPVFDCDKWSKTGTFVDTTQTDHLLSTIARGLKKELNNKIPDRAINEFYTLENKSRRVIIAADNWNELIIYLSYINNKWILTIIDKATCDCSV